MFKEDSCPATYIIFCLFAVLICFGITTCNNTVADKELKKVSKTAQTDYKSYNSESWGQGLVGGDARKKAVYATYLGIAKDNNITVYEAVKSSRSKFVGQFKNKFRSLCAFLSLPDVRNVIRTDINGKPAVVVHYTWRECEEEHCYTEHDEVTIPEINAKTYDNWETVN